MKRLVTVLFIVAYLGSLGWGVVSHAVKYRTGDHPAMYFVVWDMFCGWSAYANRAQIIAEGESGRYYEVSPPPWGELAPFGNIERRHYDAYGELMSKLIRNNLRNTSHEPIINVYVVEEVWPKQFNIPDEVWAEKFAKAKDPHRYYNVKSVHDETGLKTQCFPGWHDLQLLSSVSANPRLQRQAQSSKPFFIYQSAGSGGQQRSMAPRGN